MFRLWSITVIIILADDSLMSIMASVTFVYFIVMSAYSNHEFLESRCWYVVSVILQNHCSLTGVLLFSLTLYVGSIPLLTVEESYLSDIVVHLHPPLLKQ